MESALLVFLLLLRDLQTVLVCYTCTLWLIDYNINRAARIKNQNFDCDVEPEMQLKIDLKSYFLAKYVCNFYDCNIYFQGPSGYQLGSAG